MARSKEPDQPENYIIEPLGKPHDRAVFSCGKDSLDNYLRKQATQDAKKKSAVPFVLIDGANGKIAGYYTLAATGINLDGIPQELAKKVPRYPVVPATLLGRLAVDKEYQNKGIGEYLLMDALDKSLEHSQSIASAVVVVDPIDEDAASFYEKFDFVRFGDDKRMYLRMNAIAKLFKKSKI